MKLLLNNCLAHFAHLFRRGEGQAGSRRLIPGEPHHAIGARDDLHMMSIMQAMLREDSCCMDVGCHSGSFLRRFVELAPKGHHYAFEPIPHLAAQVRAEFPGVEVYPVALSDVRGVSAFHHVVSNPYYSGLRRRTYERHDEKIEIIRVPTCRLDDIIPADRPIDLIKIDVEGAEYQVFRGARRTLKRCRPTIFFEHGLGGADHYATTPHMVYDFLVGEIGLRIFGVDGLGPLLKRELVSIYKRNSRWNFLARP